MRASLFMICLMFVATVWAAPDPALVKSVLEKQPACQNFIRFDGNNIYLGFRSADAGRLRVVPLNGSASIDLSLPEAPVDMALLGSHAFVLTPNSLLEVDLTTNQIVGTHATYQTSRSFLAKQQATGLALYKNTLIIAHGRLGVSFFDIASGQITRQYRLATSQGALESTATGVTVQRPKRLRCHG